MSVQLPPPGLSGDLDVLAFADAELTAGRPIALITIVGLDGPFSRPLGAQLAVAGDRRFAGSISGGCLEQALTEEAQIAMTEGRNRVLRYGEGSPYLDVRLPCGGGIDLHVDVSPDRAVIRKALELGQARQRFALAFDARSERSTLRFAAAHEKASPDLFVRTFEPRLRIVLAGRGWEIVAMSQMARTANVDLVVASQESATLDYCRPYANALIRLTTPAAAATLPLDRYSALACLFHEHEWEAPILRDALQSPAFYVGALGSRQTHARRVETLQALGVTAADLARLKGPIGLFPSQDPRSIAVSALAEIIQVWNGQASNSAGSDMTIALDRTVIVLLASGLSRRYGRRDKLLAKLGGKPLIDHAASVIARMPALARVAVCPSDHVVLRDNLSSSFVIALNKKPKLGLGHSISLGAQVALQFKPDAIIMCMGDMPFIEPWLLEALLAKLRHADVVHSGSPDRMHPPTAFGETTFEQLRALDGDDGAKSIIGQGGIQVTGINAPAPLLLDVDTPEQLDYAERQLVVRERHASGQDPVAYDAQREKVGSPLSAHTAPRPERGRPARSS